MWSSGCRYSVRFHTVYTNLSVMRVSQAIPAAASAFALLILPQLVAATPLSFEEPDIEKRCANPCGYYGQVCCSSDQTCSTNNQGQAVCQDGGGGGGSGGGQWQYFTTTYYATEVDVSTITSVWSSQIVAPTGTGTGGGSCQEEYGETPCGNDCCDASSVCVNNQCVVGSSSAGWETATATATETSPATPPVRGTSNSMSTVTETAAPTTTQGFLAPVSTDGSEAIGVKAPSEGLSGGAIAGIVIGVIAGVFLLFLICACMCCRGAIDGLLALFGLGGRRRRRESTTYVDHYSHHSHGGRPEGRTWFGTRPSRPEGSEKKSGWSMWASIGIIVGAIALCLGLKRRRDHDEKSTSSYPSSYYYYSDYYTSTSMYPRQA